MQFNDEYLSATKIAEILSKKMNRTITANIVNIELQRLKFLKRNKATKKWERTEIGKEYSIESKYYDDDEDTEKVFFLWEEQVVGFVEDSFYNF